MLFVDHAGGQVVEVLGLRDRDRDKAVLKDPLAPVAQEIQETRVLGQHVLPLVALSVEDDVVDLFVRERPGHL